MLLVLLEDAHQIRQLDVQLVEAELELERRDLDELLLLGLVVLAVLVGQHAGGQGQEGEDDDDLVSVETVSRAASRGAPASSLELHQTTYLLVHFEAVVVGVCWS